MYRRYVEQWTIAIVSYTRNGKRVKEEKIKFSNFYTTDKYELYNKLKNNKDFEKLYVHEITKSFYWEE